MKIIYKVENFFILKTQQFCIIINEYMNIITKNSSNIGNLAGKKLGREIGDASQNGESLTNDIAGAIVGGAVAGVISQSLGKSFTATMVSTTVRNLNSTVDNNEDRVLNNYTSNETVQSAIKTGTGTVQMASEIISIPGNLIMGSVNGSITPVEKFGPHGNRAVDNAAKLLDSIKTNNIIVDTITSTIVNTLVMPDKIVSGAYGASSEAMNNIEKYAQKVVNNAGVLLSDIVNRVAQSFYNNELQHLPSEHLDTVSNMFRQTYPSLDSSVHNNFSNLVQNRYRTLVENHLQQQTARSLQLSNVLRTHSVSVSQNNARNLYLYNMRQSSSWASTFYWNNSQPKSDFEIRMELYNGASVSLVASRCNVPTYRVETVARSMGGCVLGGTVYTTPYYVGSFGSLLLLTGLNSSYNCSHIYGFNYCTDGFGWTGGVENDVGTIKNLNPNTRHFFAIKSNDSPFTDVELVELIGVLKQGIYDYNSFPFYSLHFNNEGFMYPVMHEVYRGTIVGKVIEFLDYIMKGFLNGDIYKDGFAESWHNNPIYDTQTLKQYLLKIKDIYKSQGKKYMSLREMLTLYDLDKTPGVIDPVNTIKGTDFQTSFRIIAYQKNIQQHDNLFLINPSFRVEYTIDMPPSYKDFLENYKETHGQYPKDYRNLHVVYNLFAETIQEMLPLLPQASKYFKMLGVINFFCYWFKTMQKIGYEPKFNNHKICYEPQINALPPIPIRYYERHLLTMTWAELFEIILNITVKEKLTNWLLDIGPKPEKELTDLIKNFYEIQLKTKTSDPRIDDDIIPSIIEVITNNLKEGVHNTVKNLFTEFGITELNNPLKSINDYRQKVIDGLNEQKKIITSETEKIFEQKTLLKEIEAKKRDQLKKFIDDSLKPLTPAQKSQNAANIDTFIKTNEKQCEEDIIQMRIKFCQLLLFGENAMNEEEIKKINVDPEKSKLVQDVLTELIENISLEEKLSQNLKKITDHEQLVNNEFKRIIDFLHNILKELESQIPIDKNKLLIKYKYLHSVVEIADQILLNNRGEKFRVVGGCGMHIKNINAEHIPNGTGLSTKIKNSNISELSFTPIDYLGEKYYVFSLNSTIGTDINSNTNENILETPKINVHELASNSNLTQASDRDTLNKYLKIYNRYGLLPIHEAVYHGYHSIVKTMLEIDLSLLEHRSQSGYTSLMIAAEQGKTSCVSVLLNAGADVDIVLYNGLFPLFLAIQNGFVDAALMLLSSPKIGNINRVVDNQMSCLHLAIELNLVPVVKKLVSMGADLFIRRKKDSFVPFHCAVANGNCEIISMLINDVQIKILSPVYSDPQLVNRGQSPLHLAITNGHIDAVKILVNYPGCPLNCQNFYGNTPLMLAIEMGNEEIAKLLTLKSTPESLKCVNSSQETALLLAGKKNMLSVGDIILSIDLTQLNYENDSKSYIYYLLVHGAYSRLLDLISTGKFNYKSLINGKSCLDIAAEFGNNLCVDYFLELGLPKHSNLIEQSIRSDNIYYVKEWMKTNTINRGLIALGVEFASISVLNLLSDSITDHDICGSFSVRCSLGFNSLEQHLLVIAMKSGSIECFKLIFSKCKFSKMNDKIDTEGNTLAHEAVKVGNLEMIETLFRAGYSFTLPNNYGISPYQLAYTNKKVNDILKSIELEENLIDIAVRQGDTKSISDITSVNKILKAAIKYEQIYVIKWLQERDLLLPLSGKELSIHIDAKINPHVVNALGGSWNKVDVYANNIYEKWSNGYFEETDWPLNVPINDQPILHVVFSQSTVPGNKLMKQLKKCDPEQKDKKGTPLIFKLLKGTNGIKDNTLFQQKIQLLKEYFPTKINSLLTQTDKYGYDIFVILDKKKLKIIKEINKSDIDLHQAVYTGQINKVAELLRLGANPYKVNTDQNTPLHIAIKNKDCPTALLLIKYMKKFDLHNNAGLTPFILASTLGLIAVTDTLKYKANIYATSPPGFSALHYAAMQGNISSIKYLLSLGMPIDLGSKQGINNSDHQLTPLYVAAYNGQLQMYNFLRINGANIYAVTFNGKSIADALISSNNQFMAEEVLSLPHFQIETEQHEMLWQSAKIDNVFMLRILYIDSIKMDACDINGSNALDLACINNSRSSAKFLINCGLNLSIDKELIKDQTILHYLNNQPKIQPLLPQVKQYTYHSIEKIKPTDVVYTASYLSFEEKQLFNGLMNNPKLEFLAYRIKTELGIRIFRKIFSIEKIQTKTSIPNGAEFNEYISNILHLLLNIAHYKEINVDDINCSSYIELYQKLNSQYTGIIRETYPELSLDELKTKFLTTSEFVKTPLSQGKLNELIEIYKKVVTYGNDLVGLAPHELKNKLIGANMIGQIAIIKQAVYNTFKYYPYNTQMISVLSFITNDQKISGNIGQIRTGEGKSIIIAMIALFYAINKRYVDIITTSHSLAIRDQQKYRKFYTSLGYESSHICENNPSNKCFQPLIVYGNISDFEFSILREKSFGSKTRYIENKSRPCDVVIIDEVDNISLDAANNSSRISDKSLNDYQWIYKPYYEYTTKNPFNEENVRKYLSNYGNVNKLNDNKLHELYISAKRAKFTLIEDIHYIVKRNKIVIVDYENTGTTMDNCTWSFGVHQFLEVKHNVELTDEDITVASMSHYSLIKQYNTVIGSTGTSGEMQERDELKCLYNIEYFDVPPHFSNKRVTLEPLLYQTNEQHTAAIIKETELYVQKGRPVLIICRTIRDVMKLSENLKITGLVYQIFTGKQITSEEEIIDKAGQANMITIATNNAGRGTDIILSKDALMNGGLHVIVTCFMKNIRTENQAKGRAGRQGQFGSCQVMVSLMDPFVLQLLGNIENIQKDLNLEILREMNTSKCSIERMNIVKHNAEIYKIFLIFSQKFLEFKVTLDDLPLDDIKKQCLELIMPKIDTNANRSLQNLTNEIIKLQTNSGTDQAWKTFIGQLKSYYLRKIMQQWSDYFVRAENYNNLQESFNELMNGIALRADFVSYIFV